MHRKTPWAPRKSDSLVHAVFGGRFAAQSDLPRRVSRRTPTCRRPSRVPSIRGDAPLFCRLPPRDAGGVGRRRRRRGETWFRRNIADPYDGRVRMVHRGRGLDVLSIECPRTSYDITGVLPGLRVGSDIYVLVDGGPRDAQQTRRHLDIHAGSCVGFADLAALAPAQHRARAMDTYIRWPRAGAVDRSGVGRRPARQALRTQFCSSRMFPGQGCRLKTSRTAPSIEMSCPCCATRWRTISSKSLRSLNGGRWIGKPLSR